MVRLANERATGIVEARASLVLMKDEVTVEGERLRRPHMLVLQRPMSAMFALSWTAVHVIDETSPLHSVTRQELEAHPQSSSRAWSPRRRQRWRRCTRGTRGRAAPFLSSSDTSTSFSRDDQRRSRHRLHALPRRRGTADLIACGGLRRLRNTARARGRAG